MSTDSTAGLSSPYQVTNHTATEELSHSLVDTSGFFTIPVLDIVDEKVLAALVDSEVIFIRIPQEHEDLALYLLSKVSQFQSLPNHVYALKRVDLRFLKETGIPYDEIR
jgi:hypothetical protein